MSRTWAGVRVLAVLLLVASVGARLVHTLGAPDGLQLVDLRVYDLGAASLLDGSLYSFRFADFTPGFPLPFTYPPFAALVLLPLHLFPFTVVAVVWQLATAAALLGVVRLSLGLLLGARVHRPGWSVAVLAWTAVGLWLEPVRTTLDFGQLNVFLVLGVLLAASTRRWWWAGALVGVLAGIKLTPAITGLYFLARRDLRAAVASAVVFAGTVVLSVAVAPAATREYFTGVGLDPSRVGPVGSAINQSLRGVLSRFAGHDVGTGPLWLAAVAAAAALTLLAVRRLGRDDRLGVLVAVQLLGLLVSPISWSHHWVWFVPTVLWLVHGPRARGAGARLLAVVVLGVLLADVVTPLVEEQPSIWDFARPLELSLAAAVYPVLAVAVLALMTRRAPAQVAVVDPGRSRRAPVSAPVSATSGATG